MVYIFTGAAAFIFLVCFDIYSLKNKGLQKKICGATGLGLLIYSAVMITVTSERINLPVALRIISGVLWIGTAFLLVYSLFLELPFEDTYGKDQYSSVLIDTGTYALCRHPGVLWFGLMFFFYFFTTGAVLVIPAGIVWTCMDILHVYLQEKLFFFKMFPEYKEYVKRTPMLVPTAESFKKCLSTLNWKEG